jgi:hypothetical protein
MVKKKQKAIHWGIIGSVGIYYGTFSTRRGAIRQHLADIFGDQGGYYQLTDIQKAHWAECRARGDRVVRLWVVEL